MITILRNLTWLRWKNVLGGFLIHLVLGTLYIWANVTSAVTSYLRKFDESISYNDTLAVYAAALAAQGATMYLGGLLGNSNKQIC